MTPLNDITTRALKMHKTDGIRYIAEAHYRLGEQVSVAGLKRG